MFSFNSSPTQALIEGSTYYFVATSLNGTSESAPTPEVSAIIPFLVPNPPASITAIGK